jgi:hypothetical protein
VDGISRKTLALVPDPGGGVELPKAAQGPAAKFGCISWEKWLVSEENLQ